MTRSSDTGEDEEEGTQVDVHVDQPSLITASVETNAPRLPADAEPETLTITPAAPRGPKPPLRPRDSIDDSISAITPRFEPDALVKAERALAAREVGASDDDDAETEEIGTLQRRVAEALAAEEDEEPTIEPRPRPRAESEEATVPKQEPFAAAVAKTEPLRPIRPQLDSEAAGHWPPWHSQAELAPLTREPTESEVATEELTRSTIADALASLSSQPVSSLPQSAPAIGVPPPVPSSPIVPAAPPSADDRNPPAFPVEGFAGAPAALGVEPALPGSGAYDPARLPRPTPPAVEGISPVAVFFITFTLAGSLLGVLVAAYHYGWLDAVRAKLSGAEPAGTAPAVDASASATPAVDASASVMTSADAGAPASTSASADAGAPASASASADAGAPASASASADAGAPASASASASASRATTVTKPKGRPRHRRR